ncbi:MULTISPECIES: hypothetical protein [unclassified Nocardioides]|uniref:hypothetical protein n=1 Tax=unclassified Nocardioides TaxID=2615069 RepID=UPI001055F53D|nr:MULTISPECIES: hypothetical protein [unclassified Nocardioides]
MRPSAALAAVTVLIVATGCSGADDAPPREAVPTTLAPADVSCPQTDIDRQHVTHFRAVAQGAPKLRADLTVTDLGHRDFCVVPDSYESPRVASKIRSYTVQLDDRDNYGERYGTFDRRPSEELLNFPFEFHVYGACRQVTATIVVRSHGTDYTYRAPAQAGPKCAAD